MKEITDLVSKSKTEIAEIVRKRARQAYECGPGWGKAADSMVSVHRRAYLSEADLAAVEAARREAYARFVDRVAPMDKNKLNRTGYLYSDERLVLPQWLTDKFPGIAFRLKCLNKRYVRGRIIRDILPEDAAQLHMDGLRAGWGRDSSGRTYFDVVDWPESSPVPENRRRRNWPRAGKLREFEKTAVDYVRSLVENGYRLKSVVQDVDDSLSTGLVRDWYVLAEKVESLAPAAACSAEPVPLTQPEELEEPEAPGVSEPAVSVCFTGTLSSMGRREAAYRATKAGMKVCSSVNAKLTYLVTADTSSESGKSIKACELGIETIDESRFLAMLAERGA